MPPIKTGINMNKDELIAKQQLEIENLKSRLSEINKDLKKINCFLWKPEQWSTKCDDFGKVAMRAIVSSRKIVNYHITE